MELLFEIWENSAVGGRQKGIQLFVLILLMGIVSMAFGMLGMLLLNGAGMSIKFGY